MTRIIRPPRESGAQQKITFSGAAAPVTAQALPASPPLISGVTVKVLFILGLILLLLIPRFMVGELIAERETYRNGAIKTITGRWGGTQTIVGPALVLPYDFEMRDAKGVVSRHGGVVYILPDTLSVEATAKPERRSHGIYDTVVYTSVLDLSGQFGKFSTEGIGLPLGAVVRWGDAMVFLGIEDVRGLRDIASLTWAGQSLFLGSAARRPPWSGSGGLSARVLASPGSTGVQFRGRLVLNGSGSLGVVPVGGMTKMQLKTSWPRPFYAGSFLPLEQQADAQGSEARWQATHLARGFPQRWKDGEVDAKVMRECAFGTDFPDPVDVYFASHRAVKHVVLFLVLTFAGFFLFETLAGLMLHPVQYFLVGAANVLFYLLLLALSEHLRFGLAYCLTVAAIGGVVTGYSRSILGDWSRALIIAALLVALYGWLYVVLMMEDHALLLGSLGLFAALAAFMYLTRRVDWFKIGRS